MEAIIRSKYLITDPILKEDGIIVNGAVYIKDKKIVEVGDFDLLKMKHPQIPIKGSGKD